MTKSKPLVAFLVLPFLLVVTFVLFIGDGEIGNAHRNSSGFTVNPTGHLTVDLEFGVINIETTDENHIDIAHTKEWKSNLRALRPEFIKWIRELPGDFEITTKDESSDTQSDIRVEGKFKRGREHWEAGLNWFTVDVGVTVPRRYNITLKTAASGDIHIDNLTGTIRAEALDGTLHLIQVPEDENKERNGDGSR